MTQDEREICWAAFQRATLDRCHPFRQPVVLSVDSHGLPSGRVLTLREANPDRHYLRFHIDRRSPKFAEWSSNPAIAAVFYDQQRRWQIRVRGHAELCFENTLARLAWDASHPMCKRTYLTLNPPGTEIDWEQVSPYPEGLARRRPNDAESEEGYRNFAVLLFHVNELDSLHLVGEGHQRFHILDESHKVRRLAP
jgi:hypothetical protein